MSLLEPFGMEPPMSARFLRKLSSGSAGRCSKGAITGTRQFLMDNSGYP